MQQLLHLTGGRLTALTLAHNQTSALQVVVNALVDGCPNLELLDLSNIMLRNGGIVSVPLERLQAGCRRLRVLRWTNTQISLAPASLEEQVAAGGFPLLEELSFKQSELTAPPAAATRHT
ncbi:uncharacterized protein LOC119102403 [Pollicipes pollicipes]|uniref:uncharacterized protein LOC119102403 n=1 Tax=Pollicipes pollicipes TaxID=41117 RepID=UPI001884A078|nr:uncharacterized protein LOC119102403 [Pollicipes pollicipes]